MKLVEFNSDNTANLRSGVASFSINRKIGLFNFNKLACELVGIKDKDQIIIHHDEEDPGNFYLEIVKKNGFVCRFKDNVTKGALFNNSALAKKIFDILEITSDETISCKGLIAGKPTDFKGRKLWGLLIKPIV